MNKRKLIFGDVLLMFGFIKRRKDETIWESLKRQGKEIREERRKVFERATRR